MWSIGSLPQSCGHVGYFTCIYNFFSQQMLRTSPLPAYTFLKCEDYSVFKPLTY